jgi:hypothetical protein
MKTKITPKKSIFQNPFSIAVFTAILSAVLSVLGGYFIVKVEAERAINEKQFEYRASAYNIYIDSINSTKLPEFSKLLNAGYYALNVKDLSDIEIQALEDKFEVVNKEYKDDEMFFHLNNTLNILRMHGSSKVRIYCEDIMLVLAMKPEKVEWKNHSKEIQNLYISWTRPNSITYGYEPKVTDEERIRIVMVSGLFSEILEQLNLELHSK